MAGDSKKTLETLRRLDSELKEKKKRLNIPVSNATKIGRIKKKKLFKKTSRQDVIDYFEKVYQYNAMKIKEDLERQPLGYNRLELIRSYDKFLQKNLKDSKIYLSNDEVGKEYKLFFGIYSLFLFNEIRKREKQQKQKTFYTQIIYTPTGNRR